MSDTRTRIKISEVSVLHLDAGHDKNGNPRRIYALVHPLHGILCAIDEGYQGSSAIGDHGWFGTDGGKHLVRQIVGTFAHRAAERKQMLRAHTVSGFRARFKFVGPNGEE